jgi:hypothetical protein
MVQTAHHSDLMILYFGEEHLLGCRRLRLFLPSWRTSRVREHRTCPLCEFVIMSTE